ncbi:MAG: adenylate kinase [Pyrinomonadaceae bacterium]|nr:adenylate kinase [Pyrinomonadaceae bacterium]
MSQIVVMMGAPGAGKGTQARLLQERRGWPQISTGDMFREIAKAETPLAEDIRRVQSEGKLISDDLVIRVVHERTNREDCRHGYILDGFPRTTAQAAMLEKLAVEQGNKIAAIFVDVPFELLEKRTSGRMTCPVCGEIYNVYFKRPQKEGVCDKHLEAQLVKRADDVPEKIRTRLGEYENSTRPLLNYYKESKRLHRVDGTSELEAIYKEIEAFLADKSERSGSLSKQ